MTDLRRPEAETPVVDRDAIGTYCEVVFGHLDGLVPVRLFAEKGTSDRPPRTPFIPVDEVGDRLVALASEAADSGCGLFVVPGTVASSGRAGTEDIRQSAVLVVDLDDGDVTAKRDHLVYHLGPPALEVASGGILTSGQHKRHIYWRLTEPAEGTDLARVAAARAQIARKSGGDPSLGRLHQPIRVPGSIHGKNGLQSPVIIIGRTRHEHDLDEFLGRAADMPMLSGLESAPRFTVAADRLPASTLATMRVRDRGQDGVTRFDAMSTVIGHWLRNVRIGHCDLEEAWEAVRDHNTALLDPPWEELRLRRDFDALLRRDIQRKGPLPPSSRQDGTAPAKAPIPPEASDDALAAEFVAASGDRWRHVRAWDRWLTWTGQVWAEDEKGHIREEVRQICRAASEKADKPHEARRIASDKTIAAVVRVIAPDPVIATASAEWDTYPMLLNTPTGIVDLVTGETRPHDPTLLLSQITTASPGAGAPGWMDFLEEITESDPELMSYLRRLAGYCLTGSTEEHMFAFLFGQGTNGKSVFLQTIAEVMGSYAVTATLDTFMASRTDRHLTELAGLRAARLVLVPETEADRSWAEARIKTVTGGEKIRANFMRRDHFEFRPQFKLLVAGNHRPSLSNVGEAMRRRLHLVPFDVTIPETNLDRALERKLLAERDGILGWMLEGCADWHRRGLDPPPRVREASRDYFETEDLVSQWIAEECLCTPDATCLAAELFASWKRWAENNGHPVGSAKSLGEALSARGFAKVFINRKRGRAGIAVGRAPTSGAAR